MVSGMGAIFTVVELSYPGQEVKANTDLMTYPTLLMAIGNLISMPLALAIGRRPMFLFSIVVLVIGGIWCAASKSLDSHIAGRSIMSLGAGQSEALITMMVQEIHFLHERGRKLAWMIFIENVAVGGFFVATQFMVAAYGWRWWYGLFTIINGVVLILALFFAPETGFARSEAALMGTTAAAASGGADKQEATGGTVMTVQRHKIELEAIGPRRWYDGLGLVSMTPNWKLIPTFYWRLLQGLLIWPIFWAFVLNGTFLGLYVFQSAEFAVVLAKPPYLMPFTDLAFVQGAQIFVCLVFLPLLGYGGDQLIKIMSKRNGSRFKAEYRLFMLPIPAAVGIVAAIIFGRAAASTDASTWTWAGIAVPYNCIYFGFLGANIVGITYVIDSFPTYAAPLLVLICAGRGIVSFGLSYSTIPAIRTLGFVGSSNLYAIIWGVLTLFAIPVYFFGPRTRAWAIRTFHIAEVREERYD